MYNTKFFVSLIFASGFLQVLLGANINGSDSKQCSRHKRVKRIIGGQDASIREFPFQAELEYTIDSGYFCGGVIIDTHHIITAAHCLYDNSEASEESNKIQEKELETSSYRIRVGSTYRGKGMPHKVLRHFIHEDYRFSTDEYKNEFSINDVAIVRLKKPIEIDGINARVIKMFDGKIEFKTKAWTSGWGYTEDDEYYDVKSECWKKKYPQIGLPKKLQFIKMKIMESKDCQKHLRYYNHGLYGIFQERLICAIGGKGKTPFKGDSGGPLVIGMPNTKEVRLVGILSTGSVEAKLPARYISIPHYRDWIDETLEIGVSTKKA